MEPADRLDNPTAPAREKNTASAGTVHDLTDEFGNALCFAHGLEPVRHRHDDPCPRCRAEDDAAHERDLADLHDASPDEFEDDREGDEPYPIDDLGPDPDDDLEPEGK
jgi:hypothetical protein